PSPFDRNALSLHVAELTQSVLEGIAGQRSVGVEHTDPRNLRKRQRPGGERGDGDANGENDREPDQPHGRLGPHSPQRTGIVNVKVEPTPAWLVTQILPPCS